jgi:hypothetical protein
MYATSDSNAGLGIGQGLIQYQIAQTRAERAAAFRLIYSSYFRAGLCEETPQEMRVTSHQLVSTTDILFASLRGETICTLSLIGDSSIGLPLETLYPREIARLRRERKSLAEVGCLADRRADTQRQFPVVLELFRLMVQSAVFQEIDQLMVAVHPRHARFYKRFMGFEQLGDVQCYPNVCNRPAVLMSLTITNALADLRTIVSFSRFFGEQLPDSMLRPRPISATDREFFQQFVVETGESMGVRLQECA